MGTKPRPQQLIKKNSMGPHQLTETVHYESRDQRRRNDNSIYSHKNDKQKKNRKESNLRGHGRNKSATRKRVSWKKKASKEKLKVIIKKSDWMKIVSLLQESEGAVEASAESKIVEPILFWQ